MEKSILTYRLDELPVLYTIIKSLNIGKLVNEYIKVSTNIGLLRLLSGNKKLSARDFSDDKLGTLLDYFSETSSWASIETDVNSQVLGVYRLEEGTDLRTFRLDAAPMQGYGKIEEGGLLQYGYHKHHANLPQFKLKLCTLDNEVNNFAYPVCHLTVNGKVSLSSL